MRGIMKRVLLFFLLGLFAVGMAAAADVNIEVVAKNSSLVQDSSQYAVYNVTISNPYSYSDTFELKVRDYSWNIWSQPLSDYIGGGVEVPAGSNYTIKLFIKPRIKKALGQYVIPLYVVSKKSGEVYQRNLIVDIVSGKPTMREYALGVIVGVDMPQVIDPREKTKMVVHVQNLYPRNITDIRLVLHSQLIKSETQFDLEPLGERILEFPLNFNKYQPPVNDRLELSFYKHGQVFKSVKINYAISGYSGVKTLSDKLAKGFLKYIRQLEIFNDGNIPTVHRISVSTNWIKQIFVHTNPPHYIIKNSNGTFMVWDINLEPQGRARIVVTQNYQALFWLAVAILVIVLFYLFMKSPVVITKEAKVMEIKEGAVSKIKVLLHIKNRTNKPITTIRIADRIPHIASINDEFDIGTIRPVKIFKNSKGGTLVKWDIPVLDPYEERIISYSITSRLHVLGSFILPSALIRFKTRAGSVLKAKSNKGRINAP